MLQRMDHHRRFNLQRNWLTKRNRIQQSVYRRSAWYMSSNSSLSTEVFIVALCSQLELTKGGNARKRRRRKRDRRVTQRRAVIISVTSASPSLSSSTLAAAAAAAAAAAWPGRARGQVVAGHLVAMAAADVSDDQRPGLVDADNSCYCRRELARRRASRRVALLDRRRHRLNDRSHHPGATTAEKLDGTSGRGNRPPPSFPLFLPPEMGIIS